MTAADIAAILVKERHPQKSWVCVREMRAGCGYGMHERTVDLFCVEASPAKGCPAVAYEIKVSKSDFKRDISKPEKHRPALTYSDRFYYVAPVGVIDVALLPPWAGLVEVHDARPDVPRWAQTEVVCRALPRSKCAPSWPFLVSMLRRVEVEA